MSGELDISSQYDSESTESGSELELPDIPARGRVKVKKDSWHLSQGRKSQEKFGGSTDNSDLEDFVEDRPMMRSGNEFDLSKYGENATVQVKSLNPVKSKSRVGQANVPRIVESLLPNGMISEGDTDESEDTENENLDVDFKDFKYIIHEEITSREKPLELRSYETLVTSRSANLHARKTKYEDDTSEGELSDMADSAKKPKKKSTKSKASKDYDSGNDSTDASDIEVSMRDYYTIRHENDIERHERRLSLTEALNAIKFNPNFKFAHAMRRSSSPGPATDEESLNSDNGTRDKKRAIEYASSESEDEVTCCSELNVTMKDYYAIRHQTATKSDGMNEFILEMNTVESRILVNDEERENKEDSEYYDTEDETVDMTRKYNASQAAKPKKKVAVLRKSRKSEDPPTEDEDFNMTEAEDRKPPRAHHIKKKSSRKPQKKLSLPDTDQEDVSCTENDLMTVDEFLYAFRNDYDMMKSGNEPAVTAMRSTQTVPSLQVDEYVSENETLSMSKNDDHSDSDDSVNLTEMEHHHSVTMTLEDLVPRVRPNQLGENAEIRMVERDGLEGSVGIIVSNPMSPTSDNVFGIRFGAPNDGGHQDGNTTDEYSDLSAALDEEIIESGRVSPATEDELMSDHFEYEGNPHPRVRSTLGEEMKQRSYPPEYMLPSPCKKVISLKENKDGTSTKEVKV